jgi:hypothetical protein
MPLSRRGFIHSLLALPLLSGTVRRISTATGSESDVIDVWWMLGDESKSHLKALKNLSTMCGLSTRTLEVMAACRVVLIAEGHRDDVVRLKHECVNNLLPIPVHAFRPRYHRPLAERHVPSALAMIRLTSQDTGDSIYSSLIAETCISDLGLGLNPELRPEAVNRRLYVEFTRVSSEQLIHLLEKVLGSWIRQPTEIMIVRGVMP